MGKKNEEISGIWVNNLDDLTFALALSVFTMLICFFIRSILSSRGMWIRASYKKIVYEAVATAELTVVSFELCFIVYENYNFFAFLFGMFLYAVWTTSRSSRPNQQMMANPVDVVAQYLQGEMRFEMCVIVIFAQTVGALASYFFIVKPAWTYAWYWLFWKDENVHTMRISLPTWNTAIITEDPIISAFTEGGVTCLMYVTGAFVEGLGLGPQTERFTSIIIKTIIAGIGTPFSGGYFNPSVATSLEYLTVGTGLSTKLWVYWMSPFLGIIIALFLEPLITPK